MFQTKVKIGPELRERMEVLCDLYDVTLGGLAQKALLSFSRRRPGISDNEEYATPRGSAPITVRTDKTPAEVRAIIDWYILPYETNPPKMPHVSAEALEEEVKLMKMQAQLAMR
jgi:hypothetical protein